MPHPPLASSAGLSVPWPSLAHVSRAALIARRTTVSVVALLLVAALIVAGVVYGAVRRTDPTVTGTVRLAGLSGEVDVRRDGQGVAHIYADTPEDLFRAEVAAMLVELGLPAEVAFELQLPAAAPRS